MGRNFWKEILAKFQDLKKSIEFCSKSYDDISEKKVDVKELIKEAKC